MTELKTKPHSASVVDFIHAVENQTRRQDALLLLDIFTELTGSQPKMWGPSIIGFGEYEYTNTTGTQTFLRTGFSPRKSSMVIYLLPYNDEIESMVTKLGKYKMGKSCLYINKLTDIDLDYLKKIIIREWEIMEDMYGPNKS